MADWLSKEIRAQDEDSKFTKIKILTEDAERLEKWSEELGVDPSAIIHKLLNFNDLFM